MPAKQKRQTHHIRYLGKRGRVAMCGEVVTNYEAWVGVAVNPSCKKCRKTMRIL